MRIEINSIDVSSAIIWNSVSVSNKKSSQVDTASFNFRESSFEIAINDEVKIYDDTELVFGGYITYMNESIGSPDTNFFSVQCIDYSYDLDGILIAASFIDKTGKEIIDELVADNASDFDTTNVVCDRLLGRIVFNQVSLADCISRLSKILGYEWYVDPDKKIYFFQRFSLVAPFDLTDTNGNYIYKTLQRTIDASQIANVVKVRGGTATETNLFEDIITVKGSSTRAFNLPYKFADLSVYLDTGGGYVEQEVGLDNIDTFDDKDVLYNYQQSSIRFENPLADETLLKFTGYKKFPVTAIVSDDDAIAALGKTREKIITDKSIVDTQVARERGTLELDLAKAEVIDCSFMTYTRGLKSGMRIKISSAIRGISDLDFIITAVTFVARTPEEFYYKVTCSTAKKQGLVEFLKELNTRGDEFEEDTNAVAEIIKVASDELTIEEEIESIAPHDAFDDFTIEDEIDLFDFEPEWVLADYIPTGNSDTKRNGRLDISMEVY